MTADQRAATSEPRPNVPFFELTDLTALPQGPGLVTCAISYGPWLAGLAQLGIPAGYVALADCALAYATTSVGPEGKGAVTISLHVDHRGPPPEIGTRIACSAQAWLLDRDLAFAQGEIVDEAGRTLASASLRSIAVPVANMEFAGDRAGERRPPDPPAESPQEDLSPVGESAQAPPPALQRLADTELGKLCQLQVLRVGEEATELRILPPTAFDRTAGVLHGGAIGVIGHLALAGSVLSALGPEPPSRLDLHIDYLRPALTATPLTLRSRLAHRSRRVAVVTAEILRPDGRPVAFARESCLLG